MSVKNTNIPLTQSSFVDCGKGIKLEDIKEEINEEESVDDPISIHQKTESNNVCGENIKVETIKDEINEDESTEDSLSIQKTGWSAEDPLQIQKTGLNVSEFISIQMIGLSAEDPLSNKETRKNKSDEEKTNTANNGEKRDKKCEKCQKYFPEQYFRAHEKLHYEDKFHPCKLCGIVFNSKDYLIRHNNGDIMYGVCQKKY